MEVVFSYLQNKEAVTELFQNVSQKIADRPGGYTRIIKTGRRLGDNAPMCFIELVDYNENMLKDSEATKKSRTRRSRRKATGEELVTPQVSAKNDSKENETVKTEVENIEPSSDIVASEEAHVVEPTKKDETISTTKEQEINDKPKTVTE